jgi:hypothetical protein
MGANVRRTTVVLPEDLRLRAQERARRDGIPFAELVRQAVEARIGTPPASAAQDPLFRDVPVYRGPAPADLSTEHDRYLYEDDG